MTRNKMILLVGGLGLAIAGGSFALRAATDKGAGFAVLTQGEIAAQERAEPLAQPEMGDTRAIKVTSSGGPAIRVSAPSGFSLSSPVDFDIRIEPNNGVAVDMSSIRIEYRIGPAWINVTRRIMEHASVKGSRLFAKGADLPPGKHAMRVSVQDAQQRVTKATVSFTVTN